jgi:hypothetical protein
VHPHYLQQSVLVVQLGPQSLLQLLPVVLLVHSVLAYFSSQLLAPEALLLAHPLPVA